MQYGINKRLVKIEQAVYMVRQQHTDCSFPCVCLGRALDTSAIIKWSFKIYGLWQWYRILISSEMCTVIGSRQILNKRPHVRGLATSKRGARVISHSSIFWARHRISESTLRDARADSESGRVGSVGPLPILNLNCTCESCRHLASQLVATPRPWLTPSLLVSWICAMPAWPARTGAAPTPISRLTSPCWCCPSGLLTRRQVVPVLHRHGLARRGGPGLCGDSGWALESQVISWC